jgi:type IV pilus assembly protein PilW
MSQRRACFSNLARRPSLRQGGFTLIELMISLVLGIVVIAAMLVMYTTGATATRYAAAQGQMNEDAQMALSVITQELRRSGNNPQHPFGVAPATATNDLGQGGWGLRACANGFTDNATILVSGLACNAAAIAGIGAGLAIVHEGDLVSGRNTAGGLPMDCIGNGVAAQGVSIAGGNYYTMQARLFVGNNALWCLGSGGALPRVTLDQVPQALAENIESMSFMFGIGSPADNKIVQGYLSADEINGNPADPAFLALPVVSRWAKVVAARACVVVISENAILRDVDTTPTYLDCDGNAVAIADGRLRRAYSTTVLIRNHGVGFEN